jgi:hypothetical protein
VIRQPLETLGIGGRILGNFLQSRFHLRPGRDQHCGEQRAALAVEVAPNPQRPRAISVSCTAQREAGSDDDGEGRAITRPKWRSISSES